MVSPSFFEPSRSPPRAGSAFKTDYPQLLTLVDGKLSKERQRTLQIVPTEKVVARKFHLHAASLFTQLFPELASRQYFPAFMLAVRYDAWSDYVANSKPPVVIVSTALLSSKGGVSSLDEFAYHIALPVERMLLRDRFGDRAAVLERDGTLHARVVERLADAGYHPGAARNCVRSQLSTFAAATERLGGKDLGAHPLGKDALCHVDAALIQLQGTRGSLFTAPRPLETSSWIRATGREFVGSQFGEKLKEFGTGGEATRQLFAFIEAISDRQIAWNSREINEAETFLRGLKLGDAPSRKRTTKPNINDREAQFDKLDRALNSKLVDSVFDAIVALGNRGEHQACDDVYKAAYETIHGKLGTNEKSHPCGSLLRRISRAQERFLNAGDTEQIAGTAQDLQDVMKSCPAVSDLSSRLRESIDWPTFRLPSVSGDRRSDIAPWKPFVDAVHSLEPGPAAIVKDVLMSMGIRDVGLVADIPEAAMELICRHDGSRENLFLPGPDSEAFFELRLNKDGRIDSRAPSIEEALSSVVGEYVAELLQTKSGDTQTNLDEMIANDDMSEAFALYVSRLPSGLAAAEVALVNPQRFLGFHRKVLQEPRFQAHLSKFLKNSDLFDEDVYVEIEQIFSVLVNQHGLQVNGRGFSAFDARSFLDVPLLAFVIDELSGGSFLSPQFQWEVIAASGALEEIYLESPNATKLDAILEIARTTLANIDPSICVSGQRSWDDLVRLVQLPMAKEVKGYDSYLALEMSRLLLETNTAPSIEQIAALVAVVDLLDPRWNKLKSTITPTWSEEVFATESALDAAVSWHLLHDKKLFPSVEIATRILTDITKRLEAEPDPTIQRSSVEALLFGVDSAIIRDPQLLEQLYRIWALAVRKSKGQFSAEIQDDVVPDEVMIAFTEQVGSHSNPRYVEAWLDTFGNICEAQVPVCEVMETQAELATASHRGTDAQFDARYNQLLTLVERESRGLDLVRYFLLELLTSKGLSGYSKDLWTGYAEDYLGYEDGKKSDERFGSEAEFKDFLQLLWRTFWNESERNQSVMAVQLFLPVAGANYEGELAGGDLGRTAQSIQSLRQIISERVNLMGRYSHLIDPYVRAWLGQKVSSIELLGRLLNLIHSQRPVMQGSKDEAAPLAYLAQQRGPLYVFLMQRALALGLPTEVREVLAQSVRNLKAQVESPKHWELVRLVAMTLPPEEYAQVKRSLGFVGAGKTWISIAVLTTNGVEILQIRRPHCEELLESSRREGFNWLRPFKTAPGVRRFVDLLPGALEACQRELNVHLTEAQLIAARSTMHGRRIRIQLDGQDPVVIHTVTPLHYSAGIGPNGRPYRRMSRIEGTSFSRWSLTASDRMKRAVAAENFFFGCVQLQRGCWNEDPGAGNSIPFEGNSYIQNGFVDFGMMNLSAPFAPDAEKRGLGVNLARTAAGLANKVNLGEALYRVGVKSPLDCSESATRSGVALGDWGDYLTPMEQLQLFMAASRYNSGAIAEGFADGLKEFGEKGIRLVAFREQHKAIAELEENL